MESFGVMTVSISTKPRSLPEGFLPFQAKIFIGTGSLKLFMISASDAPAFFISR